MARRVVGELNPGAIVMEAASPIFVTAGAEIRQKRVLVVEDGPTVTHGGMPYGAGWVAAQRYGAAAIVDPRPYAVGSIRDTYAAYPGTGPVLPAMGYGEEQVQELAETIRKLGEPSLTDVVERFLETSVPAAVASRQRAEAPVG